MEETLIHGCNLKTTGRLVEDSTLKVLQDQTQLYVVDRL